jgi:NAD(P)-dependent dehydrogenase (short-subunit alcohol dehydrogenase family)
MAVTHGRVALVTGSSRGLGAVNARRLARDGFAVAVNGRPGDEQVAAVGRDIAHAVSFLASEGAGFITGQRIIVDGGRSLGN